MSDTTNAPDGITQPTGLDAVAWRKTRRKTKTVPSGLEVTLKRVTVTDLALNIASADMESLPAPLAGLLQQVIEGGTPETALAFDKRALPDRAATVERYADLVTRAALVHPKIVDEREMERALAKCTDETERDSYLRDHILLDDLSSDDRFFILGEAQDGAQQLAPFRQEPQPDGTVGKAGAQVLDPAAPVPGSGG